MTAHEKTRTHERLDDLSKKVDEGFAAVDKKFAAVDKKFDKVDERFDKLDEKFDRKFDRLLWFLVASMGTIIAGGLFALLRTYAL